MFKKCETLLQNIVYMSIMAAINVVLTLLSTLFPYALFALVFILPLTTTVVTFYCNKKYFFIYFFATISLCMFATMWNISDTLFYVIPSLLSGFIFGIILEKNIPAIYAILLVSLLQFGFHYLSIVVIKFLLNIDIVNVFIKLFALSSHPYLSYIIPSFIFFLALTQSSITFLVIKGQVSKLFITHNEIQIPYWFDSGIILINSLVLFLFSFVLKEASLITLYISIFISIYLFAKEIFNKNVLNIVLNSLLIIVSLVLFATLYTYIVSPLQFLLFNVVPIGQAIIVFINNSLVNKRRQVK